METSVKELCHVVIETHVLGTIYTLLPRNYSRDLRHCTHAVQGSCILFNTIAEPLVIGILTFHDPVSMVVLRLQIRGLFSALSEVYVASFNYLFFYGVRMLPHMQLWTYF